jgi:long-subunit fatty acid transport protein
MAVIYSSGGMNKMGWLSGWKYRKSHVISSATGAGAGYQIPINVHYGFVYDSAGDVYLNNGYYGNTFKYTIPTADHNDYGLCYPVTLKFLLPESSSGLKVYRKYLLVILESDYRKVSDGFF